MVHHIHRAMKRKLSLASKDMQQRHLELEQQSSAGGSLMRQVVLGGQDGLVNVLGILLGIASGTGNRGVVILAGLAVLFMAPLNACIDSPATSRATLAETSVASLTAFIVLSA